MNKIFISIALSLFSISIFAQTIVGSLDRSGMQAVINADDDKPRIVTILGVNCPACIGHRNDFRDNIIAQCDNPDLRWIIFWFEDQFHDGDSLDAVGEAALTTDPRVSQYWCPEVATSPTWMDSVAYIFGGASWSGCGYFWDASILYTAGVSWTGLDPPPNDYCTAKIGGCCNTYSWVNFKAYMDSQGICFVGVGQEEIVSEANKLNAYPNPTNGFFTINYDLSTQHSSFLYITDAIGRVVRTIILEDSLGEIIIDAGDLSAGMYFCIIIAENEVLASIMITVR